MAIAVRPNVPERKIRFLKPYHMLIGTDSGQNVYMDFSSSEVVRVGTPNLFDKNRETVVSNYDAQKIVDGGFADWA